MLNYSSEYVHTTEYWRHKRQRESQLPRPEQCNSRGYIRRSPALPVHPKNNACSAGNRFTAIVTKTAREPCKPSVTTCMTIQPSATYKCIFLRHAAFFDWCDLYPGAEYMRPKMHSSKDKPLFITTALLFAGGRPPQASVWMWRQPVIDWHCHEGQTCEQAVAWFSRTTTAEQPSSDDTFIFCHYSHDFSSRHLSFPRRWNLACPKELLPCSCHAAPGELHIGDLPVTSAWFGFRYKHKEEELWEEGTW